MIDLHLHSTHSDGTLSPAELVRMAVKKKLKAISVTDHDTVSGTGEALEEGGRHDILVISGLELSVVHGSASFHLLGYGYDWTDRKLTSALTLLQDSRTRRNIKIIDKLKKKGIEITEEELQAESGRGQTGRPHIAKLLVKKGIVRTMDLAFEKYLKKDSCAYVSRFAYSAEEAINIIHNAGGVSSMAHPVQFGYSLTGIPELLNELKTLGLDGLETYYPTQKGKIRKKLTALSQRFGLLETGGSDYHGNIRLGTTMAGGVKFEVPEVLISKLIEQITLKAKQK